MSDVRAIPKLDPLTSNRSRLREAAPTHEKAKLTPVIQKVY